VAQVNTVDSTKEGGEKEEEEVGLPSVPTQLLKLSQYLMMMRRPMMHRLSEREEDDYLSNKQVFITYTKSITYF
jgi:hypothetical protein